MNMRYCTNVGFALDFSSIVHRTTEPVSQSCVCVRVACPSVRRRNRSTRSKPATHIWGKEGLLPEDRWERISFFCFLKQLNLEIKVDKVIEPTQVVRHWNNNVSIVINTSCMGMGAIYTKTLIYLLYIFSHSNMVYEVKLLVKSIWLHLKWLNHHKRLAIQNIDTKICI